MAGGEGECSGPYLILLPPRCSDTGIKMDDVVGLDDAKQVLTEVILLQNQRPDVRCVPVGELLTALKLKLAHP